MKKKSAAILLLFVMLLIATRPLAAMHLCGGTLRSFSLFALDDTENCCARGNESHYGSFTPKATSHANHVSLDNEGCCETSVIQMHTDDYQTTPDALQLSPLQLNFVLSGLLGNLSDNLNLLSNYKNSTTIDFPNRGLFLEDVDIRTYICIYRI